MFNALLDSKFRYAAIFGEDLLHIQRCKAIVLANPVKQPSKDLVRLGIFVEGMHLIERQAMMSQHESIVPSISRRKIQNQLKILVRYALRICIPQQFPQHFPQVPLPLRRCQIGI